MPEEPGRAIRWFDIGLAVATVGLCFLSTLLVVISAAVLAGEGSATLRVRLEAPYAVGLSDGRELSAGSPEEPSPGRDGPVAGGAATVAAVPTVTTTIDVGRDDVDTRALTVLIIGGYLGAAWLGVVNLRRLVRSARGGDPFEPRNVLRLRWMAVAVISVELVGRVGQAIADRTLDTDLPVEVAVSSPGWTVTVGVALGLLALSEVFRTGSGLRQLDLETV